MKDIYAALEFKLAQAKKKRLNVQSSVTLATESQRQEEPDYEQLSSRLQQCMHDDMSKQELLGNMIENKMKHNISPQNAVQAMEKNKLKDVFGSARKSAKSVSPMSVR